MAKSKKVSVKIRIPPRDAAKPAAKKATRTKAANAPSQSGRRTRSALKTRAPSPSTSVNQPTSASITTAPSSPAPNVDASTAPSSPDPAKSVSDTNPVVPAPEWDGWGSPLLPPPIDAFDQDEIDELVKKSSVHIGGPDSEQPDPKPAKKKRGRPRNPTPPPATPLPPLVFSVPVYIELERPALQVETGKGRNRTVKYEKQKPYSAGPTTIHDTITWEGFLEEIGMLAHLPVDKIRANKMTWKFNTSSRNTNSRGYPLTSFDGLTTMFSQAKACSNKSPMILVCFPSPEMNEELPPWAQAPAQQQSVSNVRNIPVQEEQYSSSRPPSIDEKLEPIVEKLCDLYPVGTCTRHPDIRCYVYDVKDWHFELDINKLNVWANAIKKVKTGYSLPPLESTFFKQTQVIGYRRGHATELQPSTPVPSAMTPAFGMNTLGYHQAPAIPPNMLYSPMFLGANPFMHGPYSSPMGPATPMPYHSRMPQQTPSSPILGPTTITVEEFCSLVNLGSHICDALNTLGFEIGDKPELVTDAQLTAAGMKPFDWARFLDRYAKFKKGHYTRS